MKKYPVVMPPTEGVSYEMDDSFLSNLKNNQPPRGEPVRLWIFLELRKPHCRFVHEFTAPTEEEALDQLRDFTSRPDVIVVGEKTRTPIPKDWLEEKENHNETA